MDACIAGDTAVAGKFVHVFAQARGWQMNCISGDAPSKEFTMRSHHSHRAGRELEITVVQVDTRNEMRLRVNGSSTFARIPFQISESEVNHVHELYQKLDGEAGQCGNASRYREIEQQLGHVLAEILFRGADSRYPAITLEALLESCLAGVDENRGEYVRLLLSFENEKLRALPWELTLWRRRGKELVRLGDDHRIALSRLDPGRSDFVVQRLFGSDGVLSVLNVGADGSRDAREGHALAARFLDQLAKFLPRLNAVSLPSEELGTYFRKSIRVTGQQPRFDIIHWRGHGSEQVVEALMGPDDYAEFNPQALVRQTDRPFLFMMITCDSDSDNEPDQSDGFSAALLAAGAPAVLGMHQTIRQDEFTYIPILGAFLFLGLPLDYSVQYLRQMFARQNDETGKSARNRWHKLVLRTTSTWYLDAPKTGLRGEPCAPRQSVAAMTSLFDELFQQHRAARGGDTVTCAGRRVAAGQPPAGAVPPAPAAAGQPPAGAVPPAPAAKDQLPTRAMDAGTGGDDSMQQTTGAPKPFAERLAASKFFS